MADDETPSEEEDRSQWDPAYSTLRDYYDRGFRVVLMALDEDDNMKLIPYG